EEGTTTTPFDMTVLNELDRFHLVIDVLERVPHAKAQAANLIQAMHEKLIEHRRYVTTYGDDMPEIRDWKWGQSRAVGRRHDERPSSHEQEELRRSQHRGVYF